MRSGTKCCIFVAIILLTQYYVFSADVAFIAVAKVHSWTQNGPATPSPQDDQSLFTARVELTRPNSLASATVAVPNGSSKILANQANRWTFQQTFSTTAALNFGAPNGTYVVRTQGSDGKKTNNVSLFGDGYPFAPHLNNFDAAQSIDPAADFILRWDPPGTSAQDFIQVRISINGSVIFETPLYPGAAGALNGAVTSLLIPRRTLNPGSSYTCTIEAWRRASLDVTGYPGAIAWGAYVSKTDIPLRTLFVTPDISSVFLWRLHRNTQTYAGPAIPSANSPWALCAFASGTAATNLSSVAFTSGNTRKVLSADRGRYSLIDDFASERDLNTTWPPGTSTFTLQTTHSGTQTIVLSNAAPNFPPVPQIKNWNDANEINPAAAFPLQWYPIPFATTNDFVRCEILENGAILSDSGEDPRSASLSGFSQATSFPAGFFKPGNTYDCRLTFYRRNFTDPYGYPGALLTAGYAQEMTARIRTRGGTFPTMELNNPLLTPGAFEFSVTAEPGRLYTIQRSTDLSFWSDYFITNAPNSAARFRIPLDATPHSAFRLLTR